MLLVQGENTHCPYCGSGYLTMVETVMGKTPFKPTRDLIQKRVDCQDCKGKFYMPQTYPTKVE